LTLVGIDACHQHPEGKHEDGDEYHGVHHRQESAVVRAHADTP